jgi:hypothetical protein
VAPVPFGRSPLPPRPQPRQLPKREDSCTFKRESNLDVREKTCPLESAPQHFPYGDLSSLVYHLHPLGQLKEGWVEGGDFF